MKRFAQMVIIAGIAFQANGQLRLNPHPWKATLKIVDDTGAPVVGATTWVSFYVAPKDQPKCSESIRGLTDVNGLFVAEHDDRSVFLGFHAEKTGYYSATIEYDLGYNDSAQNPKWNPTQTLVLTRILDPIPMYARHVQIQIPVVGQAVGFDLVESDWVAPFGKGKESDIAFKIQRRWANRNDFDSKLIVTFSKAGNGMLVASTLPFQGSGGPHIAVTAPSEGYESQITRELSNTPTQHWKSDSKNENYYLRVRTFLDENGSVKSAQYGKMYGDFDLDPINSKTAWIIFTYYLNPTPNSRNVEFDPKQNLFRNLKAREKVGDP